jgi:hypothetical protein
MTQVLGMMFVVAVLGFMFLAAMLVVAVLSSKRSEKLEKRTAALEEALTRLERHLRADPSVPHPPASVSALPTAPPLSARPHAPIDPPVWPLAQTPSSPTPAVPQETPRASHVGATTPPQVPPTPAAEPVAPVRPKVQWRSAREALSGDESIYSGGGAPRAARSAPASDNPGPFSSGGWGGDGGVLGGSGSDSTPIDWERWIGIRGAAVLGGIVLAIAGLLLFQYSIQHGLITPAMRVGIGVVVGAACLGVSEWLKSLGYRHTPEATSGAGIVILYAAFWAAYQLYALIGLGSAFALMGLTTLGCCLLSLRHSSQIIAVLGLVGGFATPLVLHSDANRPFGLFGYTLLLDLGLIAIGRGKRWPALGLLSVLGTVILQMAWVGSRMTPDQLALALGILGLFAVLFTLSGEARRGEEDPDASWTWRVSQTLGLLLPFPFVLWFAYRTDLGPHLYPLAVLMGLLIIAAGVIGRRHQSSMIGAMASCGAIAVTGVWMMQRALSAPLAWEAVAVAAVLTALLHVFVELDPRDARIESPATAVVIAAGGFYLISVMAAGAAEESGLWPWLTLWVVLWVIVQRLALLPERAPVALLGGIGTGLGLAVFQLSMSGESVFPGWTRYLLVVTGLSALASALPLVLRTERTRTFAARAAGIVPAIVLASLLVSTRLSGLSPVVALGGALVLGLLTAAPSVIVPEGSWLGLAAGLTVLVHTLWTGVRLNLLRGLSADFDRTLGAVVRNAVSNDPASLAAQASIARTAFAAALAGALIFTAWPFLACRRLTADGAAWAAAALAIPAWFPALRRLFVASFGDGAIGALPLGLAALAAAGAFLSRAVRAPADRLRRGVIVAFGASAFALVTVAVPLQLSNEWLTIGWAVQALLAIVLWRRLDHSGLKWGALALYALVAARLLLNVAVLSYHPRSAVRILNWIALTYLVPAAAMLAGAWLLRGREAARAARWESDLYQAGHDVGAIGASLGGIFVVFAWLNLTVLDWFATGTELTLHLAHVAACDLTLSIVWAVFALALLGFGMAGGSVALRWLSLSFLLLTIGKVFLYDLGELKDLYRVASLVGLAVSLLLVSLLYQRFVFRKTPG